MDAVAANALHHDEHIDTSVPLEYSTEDGSLKILGFWTFICSDLILFGCLFATYIVLHTHTAGGPTPKEIFDMKGVSFETIFLLTSSFTCGLASYEMHRGNTKRLIGWLIVTVLLGLGFIGFEVQEFVHDALTGAPISRSAFLSAFFTLVGTHGCHVSLGIVWMTSIILQLKRRGITSVTARKVFIVGIYWHFLDIVWVFLYTVVYLMGVMK